MSFSPSQLPGTASASFLIRWSVWSVVGSILIYLVGAGIPTAQAADRLPAPATIKGGVFTAKLESKPPPVDNGWTGSGTLTSTSIEMTSDGGTGEQTSYNGGTGRWLYAGKFTTPTVGGNVVRTETGDGSGLGVSLTWDRVKNRCTVFFDIPYSWENKFPDGHVESGEAARGFGSGPFTVEGSVSETAASVIFNLAGSHEYVYPGGASDTMTTSGQLEGHADQPRIKFITTSGSKVAPTALRRKQKNGNEYNRTFIGYRAQPIQITVTVIDGDQPSKNPPAWVEVTTISTDSDSEFNAYGEAGHIPGGHPGIRPHGWLSVGTTSPIPIQPVSYKAVGGSQSVAAIRVLIDPSTAKGVFQWLPPEVAGVETFTGKSEGITDGKLKILVANLLQPIPPVGDGYSIEGRVPGKHELNNYANLASAARLADAANRYRAIQNDLSGKIQKILKSIRAVGRKWENYPFSARIVTITDISLPWGGLYDVSTQGDWCAPHGYHRLGRSFDLRTRDLVGNPKNPDSALRGATSSNKVNARIKDLHKAQFAALKQAFKDAGANKIFPETDHLHAEFPN